MPSFETPWCNIVVCWSEQGWPGEHALLLINEVTQRRLRSTIDLTSAPYAPALLAVLSA